MDQQKIKLYELITDEPHLNIKDKSKQEAKQFKNNFSNSFVFLALIFLMFYTIDFFVNNKLIIDINVYYRMIFLILFFSMTFKFVSHFYHVLDEIFTLSLSIFLPNKQKLICNKSLDSIEKCFYDYNRQQLIDNIEKQKLRN